VADRTTAHPDHDTILVAALAAGDLADLPRADAETLVAACPDCATLHADLLAIAAATRALPAPARTRDYRLTAEQAERLRPSGMRRLVEAFGSSRLAVTRPLAVAFTTLGIAGLLLSAIPAGGPALMLAPVGPSVGEGGATVTDRANDIQGGQATAVPAFGLESAAPVPAASPQPDGDLAGEPAASGQVDEAGGEPKDSTVSPSADLGEETGGAPWLPLLSIALLATGLGLFSVRLVARRLSGG
jgi:hypothetical protein